MENKYYFVCVEGTPTVRILKRDEKNETDYRIYQVICPGIVVLKTINLFIENKVIEDMINKNQHWKLSDIFTILVNKEFKKIVRDNNIPYVNNRTWKNKYIKPYTKIF
jgi:hypothetical protein